MSAHVFELLGGDVVLVAGVGLLVVSRYVPGVATSEPSPEESTAAPSVPVYMRPRVLRRLGLALAIIGIVVLFLATQ